MSFFTILKLDIIKGHNKPLNSSFSTLLLEFDPGVVALVVIMNLFCIVIFNAKWIVLL